MPQLAPLFAYIGGASAAATAGATWTGVASIATYYGVAKVALIAGAAAYSRSQAKKAERSFNSLRDQGSTATFADPTAPTRIIYGDTRVGGTTIFAHTTGTKNEQLHQVCILSGHDLSEIGDFYFGDLALGMPWNGGSPSNQPDAGNRYYGKVRINRKIAGGAADSELVSESGGAWTTDDKLTGLTSFYVKLTWNTDIFPQGANFNISCDVKGKECYDPRSATTGYTNNPALILRDYLVSFLGYSTAEIDDADVIAAANICDESVTIADTTTQARYTFNGILSTGDLPPDNRNKIARAMAGWCAKIGGKWRMSAGAHKSSSWSMTMSDLRGPIDIQNADEIASACNAVRGVYLNPDNNWAPADAPLCRKLVTAPNITAGARCAIVSVGTTNFTLIGAASNTVGLIFTASGAGTGTGTVDPYLGEDNGVQYIREIDLFGVTDEATALRLMRIELERARHQLTLILPCKMDAMKVQAGDYIDITESRYGWTNKLFEVVAHRTVMETQEEGLAIGCDLTVREVSSAIYTRASADETSADPSPNSNKQDPWDVTAPVLGTLESDDAELTTDSRGLVISRIKVPWTCSDPYVLDGGTFEIEYKLSADADWLPAPIQPLKGTDEIAWIGPVTDGSNYDVRIRAVNGIGAHSDWDTETAHTVIGKSADPAPVTSLAVEAIPGGAILTWVEPADLDIGEYWIYEHTANSIPANPDFIIPAPANSWTRSGVDADTALYWWVKAVDTSGNASTAAGSVTTTPLATNSPTYQYQGIYSASDTYYHNDNVRSVVKHGSSYYRANNVAKDGLATWGTPATDWEAITWIPQLAATDLLLAKDIIVLKKITMGDGTSSAGQLITTGVTGYGTGASGVFLGMDGTTPKLYIGSSTRALSWSGTALNVVGDSIQLGSASYPFTLDIDSSFVGPNPPARMTFGSMVGSATASGVTYLGFSSGGVGGGDFSMQHSPVYGLTYNHGIALNTGDAKFRDITTTGDVTVGDDLTVTDSMLVQGTARVANSFEVTTTLYSPRFDIYPASNLVRCRGASTFQVLDGSSVTKFSVDGTTGAVETVTSLQVGTTANVNGNLTAASMVCTAQGSVGGTLTVGNASSAVINFHTDTNLYRSGASILKTDDAFEANNFISAQGIACGSGTDFFAANSSEAYFEGIDFTVYASGGANKFRVISSTGEVQIAGSKVVSTRQTGWAAASGSATRSTFATTTVTTEQLAERVKGLIDDLISHGLIGA